MAPTSASWDVHVHTFNPATFPYSSKRTYTPPAAYPKDLFAVSPGTNFLLVQATIENGPDGLLHHLNHLTRSEPSRIFRGAIMIDSGNVELEMTTLASKAKEWHAMGVRCIRIHGRFHSPSSTLVEGISSILNGPIAEITRQNGWCISIRLPVEIWAALEPTLESECQNLTIIAEHCGAFMWPLPETQTATFETFLGMLRKRLIYVKLGALHRRMMPGHSISELAPALRSIANAGPRQLLWGSDWPHVNTDATIDIEAPFLECDENAELEVIRGSMDKGCFDAMLKETPERLFC